MSWNKFYTERINSSYQDYFEERYKPFLNKIIEQKPKIILEEGCGIGSVSKAVAKSGINFYGFDIDPNMVRLSRTNLESPGRFYKDCILDPKNTRYESIDLIVTHGVLEHFSDNQIRVILERYQKLGIPSIHYVPLNKYKVPSFGDERLLPAHYWVEISKCRETGLFNDDFDLWFLI